MAKHSHTMVSQRDGQRFLFACEGCSACVEIVPIFERVPDGTRVTSSARVRDAGIGGFSLVELGELSQLWLGCFRAFVDQDGRSKRRVRHKRARMSRPQLVGAWFDPSGVDHSAV